jgi:hypothetical protein
VFAADAAQRLADRRMLGVERMSGDASGARDCRNTTTESWQREASEKGLDISPK